MAKKQKISLVDVTKLKDEDLERLGAKLKGESPKKYPQKNPLQRPRN